ncbi:PGM2 [Cordylochernes scorpioides]|uniref:PGM2 n=1 Tax=Cordylochernes scorpioides TaxID=51811 RepID=A0ABY6L5A3_9ARAC|nr:PGM2 [Cordylochernes scorpioides]
MKRSLEQRYAIKICAFKEGREEFADEPRSGRPTTARTDENVDRVLEILRTDRLLSIQQIADTLHMSTFVVHGIVTEDLQMRKVCAKFVPKVLTQDQKELRVLRCQELLDLIQNEPGFLNSVVTGDESWMFEYDQVSKRQSCAWHKQSSPSPRKARMSKSRIKTMIIVFFDIRGIVHCEFVPQGQTVNSAFYLEVLRRLKRRIARVRTDIKDTVKLYHDNATSHTAFIITNFLARSNTPVIPHPPYSLDLAPCDFFLFPRLKREMKGKHWETVENIQHHVTTFLRSIPVEGFQGAFQAWQTRLRKPKEENGYRIYWENGALINTPHDKAIQDSILANLKPWQSAWEFSLLNSHHVVRDSLDEVISRYLCMLTNNVVDSEINTSSTLKFTYTVLHGIGYTFMSEAFKACGFNCVTPVEPQMYPDPSFPTIRVPDPNEGNEVFDLAIKTADENFSSIVLAVDPDAQCLGVAEKLENNQWRIFTGDEIGALLGCWMWNCYKTENPDCNPSNVYMISSAVSSKILRAIAKAEGFNFEETLPGFKWMANKAEELLLKGKIVLFVFEEALGFMCGTSVLERDAIASAMQVTQLAAHLHNLGMTLDQELRNIYSRYGLHISRNSCFICHHWPTILSLFERIREYGGYNTYPTRLGHYSVLGVRDLTAGVDTTQEDHHPILPTLCSCQMITFYFKNNFQVTLRTDEVEPKIKYNIELCALPDQGDWTFLEKELNNLEKLVVREWLRPDSNRLILHSESKE